MLSGRHKKTSCCNLPTSQLSSFLFRVEAIIYLRNQLFIAYSEKMFTKNIEMPLETPAKVKFLVLLQAVSVFIINGVIITLSNISDGAFCENN